MRDRQKEIERQIELEMLKKEIEERPLRNPAFEARYDAQRRFFNMGKLRQTLARVTGQYKKFNDLWMRAGSSEIEEQDEIKDKLDKMFR